jgi:hypothetical protein
MRPGQAEYPPDLRLGYAQRGGAANELVPVTSHLGTVNKRHQGMMAFLQSLFIYHDRQLISQ